jgi:hypothetical protein
MKRLLMLGLACAASLFATAARADVDLYIGVGVPQVEVGSHHHHHHRPHARHHRHYAPPVYYPPYVYRHAPRHYRDKQYSKRNYRPHAVPPAHWQQRNTRPLPPPYAKGPGYWQR